MPSLIPKIIIPKISPLPLKRTVIMTVTAIFIGGNLPATAESVAKKWSEVHLSAIRKSFPDPPVNTRNLFHLSAAMYDAWAAYDQIAVGYVHRETAVVPEGMTLEEAREEAVSYAANRILIARYINNPHPRTPASSISPTQDELDSCMSSLGYDSGNLSTIGEGPAAVGNRAATTVLEFADSDQSRQSTGYDDPTYSPTNAPLDLQSNEISLSEPNRWQPLQFGPGMVQTFIGAHWQGVRPFALHLDQGESVYLDPGPPPYWGTEGQDQFVENNLEVIRFSSFLDPDDGVVVNTSPGALGNSTLGTNDGVGHPINPSTSSPYAANMVKRGDYGRVSAEYWADGPNSETPPGHWNDILNDVMAHPNFEPRWQGQGPRLPRLEWEVKAYFVLNAALYDAAIAIWDTKRIYDYVRPISSIRWLGDNGHLPEEPGLVEEITAATTAPGGKHEHLAGSEGQTAIYAWGGKPSDPTTEYLGSRWILAKDWQPYQQASFVTPSFAGYVSGHSGFSRASAEVLTTITGDPFFPGGLETHLAPAGSLGFEFGPSEDVTLQWATYYDAADEAGLSRLYGGIHVAPDDGPGRIMGSRAGQGAFALASKYFDGSIFASSPIITSVRNDGDSILLEWDQDRGVRYELRSSPDLLSFQTIVPDFRAPSDKGSLSIPKNGAEKNFFFLVRKED